MKTMSSLFCKISLFTIVFFQFNFVKGAADTMPWKQIPLKSLDGTIVDNLKLNPDRPTYIKFWASWCQPCIKQMPHLQYAYQAYNQHINFVIVNIDVNDSLEDIQKLQKQFGLSMPIFRDFNGELAQFFHLMGTPLHVLLAPNGGVLHQGHNADEKLDQLLSSTAEGHYARSEALTVSPTLSSTPDLPENDRVALFLSSTWCDWYLKESRPAISQNCIAGNSLLATLPKIFPKIRWQGYISRLWTGEPELTEFKSKYDLNLPLEVDTENTVFLKFKVNQYPTLILLEKGKIVGQIQDFTNPNSVKMKVENAFLSKEI